MGSYAGNKYGPFQFFNQCQRVRGRPAKIWFGVFPPVPDHLACSNGLVGIHFIRTVGWISVLVPVGTLRKRPQVDSFVTLFGDVHLYGLLSSASVDKYVTYFYRLPRPLHVDEVSLNYFCVDKSSARQFFVVRTPPSLILLLSEFCDVMSWREFKLAKTEFVYLLIGRSSFVNEIIKGNVQLDDGVVENHVKSGWLYGD